MTAGNGGIADLVSRLNADPEMILRPARVVSLRRATRSRSFSAGEDCSTLVNRCAVVARLCGRECGSVGVE